jgi:polyisoprenoid-binding protein YceI
VATWRVDPSGTSLRFAVKHFVITTVRGGFARVEGELDLDEADPTNSHGEIRVASASLSTGIERRDNVFRGDGVLDAEPHPWVIATVAGIRRVGDHYGLTVDLAIRGETRPVDLDCWFRGFETGSPGTARRAGFRLEAALSRKAWGLHWHPAITTGGWGDQIRLEMDLAAVETPLVGIQG